jgi:hypothetical protein
MIQEDAFVQLEVILKREEPVAELVEYGAQLFAISRSLALLAPLYHLRLSDFIEMFTTVMAKQIGLTGITDNVEGLQAKAIESMSSLTAALHKQLAAMLSKKHLLLFEVLVSLESMKRRKELSPVETQMLIHGVDIPTTELSNNALNTSDAQDASSPDFSDPTSSTYDLYGRHWNHLLVLESEISAFQGLSDCISTNESAWAEYFSNPVISLVNPVPGEMEGTLKLSISQRAILWRVFVPSKMALVFDCIITYELGATLIRQRSQASYTPTIRDQYKLTEAKRPFLIMTNSQQKNHKTSKVDCMIRRTMFENTTINRKQIKNTNTP